VLAVEHEGTGKGRARLRRILAGYIASRHIGSVRYYTTSERVCGLVKSEVLDLKAHALIEVHNRFSAAPAESRAA
jgi:hypothetical protein